MQSNKYKNISEGVIYLSFGSQGRDFFFWSSLEPLDNQFSF